MDFRLVLIFIALGSFPSRADATTRSRLNNKLFLFQSPVLQQRSDILTLTSTQSYTVTRIEALTMVCAKLINVTGACKRRRGTWVEEPIVLSFDEHSDEAADLLYSPVVRVERTASPETTSETILEISENYITTVASSVQEDSRGYQRQFIPVFFYSLSRWFNQIFNVVQVPRTRKQIAAERSLTNTIIYQRTSTFRKTKTIFNTIFVQRCTPSPFPFRVC